MTIGKLSAAALLVAGVAAHLACTGKTDGSSAVPGTCYPDVHYGDAGMLMHDWVCSTSLADASRTLVTCPVAIDQGGFCPIATVVDSSDPTMPEHVTTRECLDCTSGTDWACGPQGWESGGSFACRQ